MAEKLKIGYRVPQWRYENETEWHGFHVFNPLQCLPESELQPWQSEPLSYEELKDLSFVDFFPKTWYRRKEYVLLPTAEKFDSSGLRVYPGDRVIIRERIESAAHVSLKDLAEILPAKKFIEYAKQQGLTVCPLQEE